MDKNLQDLLAELLLKCYEINMETKCDIFFNYAPHCNIISVYIYENGWNQCVEPIYLSDVGGDFINVVNLNTLLTKLKTYENK